MTLEELIRYGYQLILSDSPNGLVAMVNTGGRIYFSAGAATVADAVADLGITVERATASSIAWTKEDAGS